MAKCVTAASPGKMLNDVVTSLGRPTFALRHGDKATFARRSRQPFTIATNETVLIYCYDGIPYFNAYIHIDDPTKLVKKCDIENLWW